MSIRAFTFNRHSALALLAAPAVFAPLPALAQAPNDDDTLGESPERYAQVRVVEGDVRIVKGDADESLSRGVPVAEGDVVESRGRGVLQLGDGTRIAFGAGTRFQVAALFTDRKGDRQVLLRLDYGRLRVQLGSLSEASVRIDTPSGTLVMGDGSGASCEVDRENTVQVRVHQGRARFANNADRTALTAGDRLTVYGNQDRLDRVRSFNTYDSDSFDTWCAGQFQLRRASNTRYLPREISAYGDDLNDDGEWIYVDDTSSWCWRPLRVSVDWRPYWRGRWGAYAGGMTWVADEPWGYVTHHYGRWGWTARFGWYWIPGVYYSPAWVAWNSYDSYFGWAPLGYWNSPVTWGYGAWGGSYCWNVVHVNHIHYGGLNRHIYSDAHVITTFNRGTGASTWSSSGPGRSLTPPWQRGRVAVTRQEFGNPAQFQRAVTQRPLMRDRINAYERQAQSTTGRSLVRREAPVGTAPARPDASGAARTTPFEDRSRAVSARPLVRDSRPLPSETTPRETRPQTPDRNIDRTPPRERIHEERPRDLQRGERGAEPDRSVNRSDRSIDRSVPREQVREDRPRDLERTPSRETPRERIREERPRDLERTPDRSVDRPAPREVPKDRTPDRNVERPAPREVPRERPREERPREVERPAPPREIERPSPPREFRQERSMPSAPSSPDPGPSRSSDRPLRR
ncbi:MAG: FecR domain-containing protein [Firmicutes bacterium]|nr:FecR domain-containing protein [Bacillota bacterium]